MVKHKFAKIFLLLILLITVVIIIYMIIGLLSGSNNYEDLIFHNFNLQDEYFSVNVETWSSGKTFRKYKYKIEGENLYLTIRSGLAMKNIGTGILEVEIKDKKLTNVKNVYVKNGKEIKLIWTRSN